ncbi:MAG: FtsQ-type POTRA domain-containing protein [Eubacteriales bacterium]
MAKHSKKNNIISYDEAKHKKELEREELLRRAAKHSKEEDFDEFEDYDSGYDNDAPKEAFDRNSRVNRGRADRLRRSRRDFINDSEDEFNKKESADEYPSRFKINTYDEYDEAKESDYDEFDEYEDYEEYDEGATDKPFDRRSSGKYSRQSDPLPRNLVNFIIIAAMSIFLIGFTVFVFSQYVVETITIIGNDTIKYHEITTLCGIEYKESMFKVKKEDIVETFERQKPMIEVVEIKKIWPNTLEIYVRERPPICYIVLKGSQKCALIGEDNICLAIEDSYLNGDLPRIYGIDIGNAEIGKELDDSEIRKLEVLQMMISSMIETNCISELESININNTTNITMESTSGTRFKIGDTSNMTNKFKVVKIAIQRLIMENDTDCTVIVPGDDTFYKE